VPEPKVSRYRAGSCGVIELSAVNGSAISYRTSFSAKLARIFSTCGIGENCSRMKR